MLKLKLNKMHHLVEQRSKLSVLEYADLAIIDILKASSEDGHAVLAIELREALLNLGFFYVMTRMFDIADVPFSAVTDDEKQNYPLTRKQNGMLQGYTSVQYVYDNGWVCDQLEQYCNSPHLTLVHHDVTKRRHPEALLPLLPEIQEFSNHNYFNVLHPILRLIAHSLELPEDTLLKKHVFGTTGETAVRFIKYYQRTEEEEAKTKNVWLKGHMGQ
ncbi:uncharacterized protein EDB93DRAFT_1287295 [Suillus bovinus]|uniref:uncharacterized protein n=1 Tax=Suillus bovinus TaxID=48563 RepID=UPI001B881975|nr:uncharacterized protein EDB93DRAFT_1287295 [Suillus bovinus]KAG2146057.1 hypothetical protein EDB93DRAFT_1287295 [Suillus bovinus]